MRKKLSRVGKSQALIMSKVMLGLMGLGEGAEVEVQMLGPMMLIGPADLSPAEVEMALAFAKVLREDREVLERLAQ